MHFFGPAESSEVVMRKAQGNVVEGSPSGSSPSLRIAPSTSITPHPLLIPAFICSGSVSE